MTRSITDVLQNALEGIAADLRRQAAEYDESEQSDNPDPKLDALGRHIAVVLADLEAAAASEASEPTDAKQPVIVEDQPSAAAPETAPSKPTDAKKPVIAKDQPSTAAPKVAPSKPTAAKWRVVKDPRLTG